jgi:hypothetical protein
MPKLPASLSSALCRFLFRRTRSQLRPVLTGCQPIWLTTSFVVPEFSSSSPTVMCCCSVYLRPRNSAVGFSGYGQRQNCKSLATTIDRRYFLPKVFFLLHPPMSISIISCLPFCSSFPSFRLFLTFSNFFVT